MNNPTEREKFFFAQEDADYYDETIELAVPHYKLILQTMLDVIDSHFRFTLHQNHLGVKGVVMDVGAGTGAESIPLLMKFPGLSLLAVDLSEQMKPRFEQNFSNLIAGSHFQRIEYIVSDIFDICNTDQLIKEFFQRADVDNCIAAVSAYCIHHFSVEDKRRVYQKMYEFLQPGGILVNVDLFKYDSSEVSRQVHEFDIAYIEMQFEDPDRSFAKACNLSYEIRKHLKEKWVHHMNYDNLLDSVDIQIAILEDIGFVDAECVFRYFQQGIIRATKPI